MLSFQRTFMLSPETFIKRTSVPRKQNPFLPTLDAFRRNMVVTSTKNGHLLDTTSSKNLCLPNQMMATITPTWKLPETTATAILRAIKKSSRMTGFKVQKLLVVCISHLSVMRRLKGSVIMSIYCSQEEVMLSIRIQDGVLVTKRGVSMW